jgi:hypothetical protein
VVGEVGIVTHIRIKISFEGICGDQSLRQELKAVEG